MSCPVDAAAGPGRRKPCTGDANSYWRHRHRGEEACRKSKDAYKIARRRERANGLWNGNLPYEPDDEQRRPVPPTGYFYGVRPQDR